MSAYEDFCGCGEWSCVQCHGSDAVPGSDRNAHVHGVPPEREPTGAIDGYGYCDDCAALQRLGAPRQACPRANCITGTALDRLDRLDRLREPSVESMRGILAGRTHVGPEADAARMDMLEDRGVVSIHFADGSQLNCGSLRLRAALDLLAPCTSGTPDRGLL